MDVFELEEELSLLRQGLRQEQEEKCQAMAKLELLESGIETAKESEKKMLESLISQTKQLEQTKISLEEAKLEIKNLHEAMEGMVYKKELEDVRAELMQALDAEAKSTKALDDLAIALKEVSTESTYAKQCHLEALYEHERFRAETERLKAEAEESMVAWRAKESGFIKCMKASEEEIASLKAELKDAVEEISKLRDQSNAIKKTTRDGEDGERTTMDGMKNWSMQWNQMRDTKLLEGSIFDEKDGGAAGTYDDDLESFDHALDSPMRLRKKRQALRKFGDLLRRRSCPK